MAGEREFERAMFGARTTLIGRTLTWLVDAFQLQGQHVPRVLSSRAVVAMVDAAEGGWPFAYNVVREAAAGPGAAAVREYLWGPEAGERNGASPPLPTGSRDEYFLGNGIAVQADHSGGAGPVSITFGYRSPFGIDFPIRTVSLAVGAIAGTVDFLGTMTRYAIPPGTSVYMDFPITGGGEVVSGRIFLLAVPLGFAPR